MEYEEFSLFIKMLKNKEIKYWINIRKEIKKIYGSMINYIYILQIIY